MDQCDAVRIRHRFAAVIVIGIASQAARVGALSLHHSNHASHSNTSQILTQVDSTAEVRFLANAHLVSITSKKAGVKEHPSETAIWTAALGHPVVTFWYTLVSALQKHFQLSGPSAEALAETQPSQVIADAKQQLVPTRADDAPRRQVITKEGRDIQRKVYSAVFVIVFGTYAIAFASTFLTWYRPPKDRPHAFITQEEHHPEDSPDTDDEDEPVDAEGGSQPSPPQSSEIPSASPKIRRANSMAGSLASSLEPKAFRTMSKYLESGHVTVEGDELVETVGLSAMSVFAPDAMSGITKLPNKVAVPLIAIQSMFLQVGLLHFLATQLLPKTATQLSQQQGELPMSIIFIAVYLHFLNCVQELPYSWQLFRHLPDFHPDPASLTILGSVLITDAFVIPLLSFILGGLYLCTSRTIGDAILNAVAVAFVREIDNWILGLNTRSDFLSGKIKAKTIHIPVNRNMMRRIAWTIIFMPIIPLASSMGICWIGFYVLNL